MRIGIAARAVVVAAALGLMLAACDVPDASPAARSAASSTDTRTAPATRPSSSPASSAANTASDRPGSRGGLCFDPSSALGQRAIASLGTDSNGGEWRVAKASSHRLSDGCGLDWVMVDGTGFNDATYTSRVLLFGDGKYLGIVEPHEFSYTSIAGETVNSVSVSYRWLRKDDPFCCPQGGPTTVTVKLAGGRVTRTGQFPPEV